MEFTGVAFPESPLDVTPEFVATVVAAFMGPKNSEDCAEDPDCSELTQEIEIAEAEEKDQQEEDEDGVQREVAVPSSWHFAMVVRFTESFPLGRLPGLKDIRGIEDVPNLAPGGSVVMSDAEASVFASALHMKDASGQEKFESDTCESYFNAEMNIRAVLGERLMAVAASSGAESSMTVALEGGGDISASYTACTGDSGYKQVKAWELVRADLSLI